MIIQTWWRIYKARTLLRQKLKSHVVQLRLKYYDDNAVKVRNDSSPSVGKSKYFRFKKSGEDITYENMFWIITVDNDISMELNRRTNKFGLNYVFNRNQFFVFYFRSQLNEYREYLEQKQLEEQRQANINKLEDEAKKTHYLVSTKAVPGIYNSKYLE